MKKITAILICSVLLVGLLSGCGATAGTSSKEAYDLYQNMSKAMADIKSLDMDMSAKVDITMSGSTINTVTTGNIKTVNNSDTDVNMAMNLTTSAMGTDTPILAYYTNGIFYMNTSGMKYKMPLSVEDAKKQAGIASTLEFPESAIKDCKVTDVDGGKKINLTLDGSAISSLANQALTSMQALSPDVTASDLTISDVTCEAVIDTSNNMLKSYDMVCSISTTVQNNAIAMNMDTSMTINSYNDVTIDLPADLDTYADMPTSALPAN